MQRPTLIREVGWVFYFAFILVTLLFILCQLFSFSFSLSFPLPSTHLQVKKCWRESLECPVPTGWSRPSRQESRPSRQQSLPCGYGRCPSVLAVPLRDASPCGVVHTMSGFHPACPMPTRAGARRVGNDIPRVGMACSFFCPCAWEESVQGNGEWNLATQNWASEPHVLASVLGWGVCLRLPKWLSAK